MATLDGRKILVVEDEMIAMRNMEFVLENLGCLAIFPVSSVLQAFTLLAIENFDLAILDVNLGKENSYPIADLLIARGIPFAFSTGYLNHGARTDLNSHLVLRKPYLAGDVALVVDQLLAR